MTPQQAYVLVSALAGAFPWLFSEPAIGDLWAGQIRDLPFEPARQAVERVIKHHDRPTIKLIREVTANVASYLRPPELPVYTEQPVSPEEIKAGLERFRKRSAEREREAAGAGEGGPSDLKSPRRRPPPDDCPDCGEPMIEGHLRHAEKCLPRIRLEARARARRCEHDQSDPEPDRGQGAGRPRG